LLLSVCFPSGDDTDARLLFPIAVAHDQNSKRGAQPQKNEAVLFLGVFGIRHNPRVVVKECAARLLDDSRP
jgi:hypothetical protein